MSSTADEAFVSIGQIVNIGSELKRELERIAGRGLVWRIASALTPV